MWLFQFSRDTTSCLRAPVLAWLDAGRVFWGSGRRAGGGAWPRLPRPPAAAAAADPAADDQAYLQAQPAVLQAAGGHCAGDFACQAWLHAVLRCTDEASAGGRAAELRDCSQQDLPRIASTAPVWVLGMRFPTILGSGRSRCR
jgi:hypothetical protein